MSKRLDKLNAEYEKVKKIASRKRATLDSFQSFIDKTDNALLAPPYAVAHFVGMFCWHETVSDIVIDMEPASKKTSSGRDRNKFEIVAGTIVKNLFSGILAGVSAVLSVAAGIGMAAVTTPFAAVKVAIEGPIIARNKIHNKRTAKAKQRLIELENKICKEVQNPSQDKAENVTRVSKASKFENADEEIR